MSEQDMASLRRQVRRGRARSQQLRSLYLTLALVKHGQERMEREVEVLDLTLKAMEAVRLAPWLGLLA